MSLRLLETKFHIPPARPGGVERPRLTEELDAGLTGGRKLTLVSAPAGYGKTTLIAGWLASPAVELPRAWLSLDEADNDPTRFLGYFISAFQRNNEDAGGSALSLLGNPTLPPLNAVMDELLNDLVCCPGRLVLVLDDYHTISNPQIHEVLEYFIENQPAHIHIAITTREDPPLPLARMRARGQMTEIRAHDLRFTLEEARQFFNQSMRLNLTADVINVLETRTEGWAAGLQLTALALQNLPDQQDFLADFSGSHRYIIDYLLDEVLRRQPPEIREFLGKTAALKRFNAELCEAVTGSSQAEAILRRLENSNLFLIPLDDRRGWYRYHHLFADVLRAGLPAEDERSIHTAAAGWFESQGFPSEAVQLWLAAGAHDQAVRLISRLTPDLVKNGELQTMLSWLNALPRSVVDADPELTAFKALSLLLTSQIAQAQEYTARAFNSPAGVEQSGRQGRLLALQAWFSSVSGGASTTDLARAALLQIDGEDLFFRGLALIALGNALSWRADLPASSQVFRETWELGRQMEHPFISMGALSNLAFNLLEMGQLREAEDLCRSAMEEYVDRRGRQLPVLGIIYAPLSCICYEKGEFEEAKDLAERGLALCRKLFSSTIMGGDSEITLARIAFEDGRALEAFAMLDAAADLARRQDMGVIVYKMAVMRTDFYILLGRLAEAEKSLKELEAQTLADQAKSERVVSFLNARFLILSGRYDEGLKILDEIEQAALDSSGRWRWMSIQIHRALALQGLGRIKPAAEAFGDALGAAAAQGYRMLFSPQPGRPTLPLLRACRGAAPEFVDSIIHKYAEKHPAQEALSSPALLPDPLSEQETRILKLIVAGMSNQEIAGELFISPGTAKWHVHNILRKLGTSNRPQAIARARELGM